MSVCTFKIGITLSRCLHSIDASIPAPLPYQYQRGFSCHLNSSITLCRSTGVVGKPDRPIGAKWCETKIDIMLLTAC